MIRLLLSILLFFTIVNLHAQTVIQGTVSNQHNSPIPYSAMGIKNSRVAALANENGSYRLVVPDSLQHKPIIFSAIGHVERSMTVIELKTNSNVVLDEKIQTLNEVVINTIKLKEKTVGQRSRPMLTFSRMFDHTVPTIEQGSIFEIFPQTRLKSFRFYIIPSSKFSKINLKVNLYSVNGNTPDKSVLNKTILFQCTTTGWQHIDLSPYDLKFKDMDKIAITLQLIEHT
ncbi:MAG: oxidoreductase, partial [Pedobacter sp.]